MALIRQALTRSYAWSLAPAARRFERSCQDPASAQKVRLAEILAEIKDSRRWGQTVASPSQFHKLEPTTYEDYRADIQDLLMGHPAVLTRSPVLRVEASGGTTGPGKWLPMTAPFLAEVQAGVNAWLHRLYSHHPRLHGKTAYWSITPGPEVEKSPGGVPMGGQDSDYLGRFARFAWNQLMAVPPDIHRSKDWQRDTLRALTRNPDLALISIWSPTLWLHLLDGLEQRQGEWLPQLPESRQAAIRSTKGPLWRAVWPDLEVVSCWTDGPSRQHADELTRRMPGVHVQGKGLLATEGVVTVPWAGNVAVPNGHVLEFEKDSEIHGLHELREGETYEVLLTTSAGLLRYRLGDRVEVTGHHHKTPKLAFLGRDRVVDLVGEKLHETWVDDCWRAATGGKSAGFTLLAPRADGRGYTLFTEGDADVLGPAMEHHLQQDHGYAYARRLGQLDALTACKVTDGLQKWQDACVEQGQRLGDLKPALLDSRRIWEEVFSSSG